MPGNVHSLTPNGDRTAGRRTAVRGVAVLLAVVVAATSCGGDPDADEDAGQAQELESLLGDGDDQEAEEAQEQGALPEEGGDAQEAQDPVAPVVSMWPHCSDYGAVLDALAALEGVEAASGDAVRGFESAADAAVASAEALAADASAESEARAAGRRAVEVFAAADDAALFAAYGETSVALGTPTYSAAYESALAAAWEQAGTGRVTAEARLAAAESAASEAGALLEQAGVDLEAALEAMHAAAGHASEAEASAHADAQEAAAAVSEAAALEAAALEAVAAVSAAAQGAAYSAARGAAHDAAADNIGLGGFSATRRVVELIALMAGHDASWAARAALAVRLDLLAERAGLATDITAAAQAGLSAWVEAWPRAEAPDWRRRVNASHIDASRAERYTRGAEFVFDRQAAYDNAGYRAVARAVRVAVADSVPSSESVAAAEAEDAHWAEGGAAHRAFVAAQNLIAAARAGHTGRIHPGTDEIASNAYDVAIDVLESDALAEAADIRADAASRPAIDIESDPRVVEARAAAERSDAAAAEAQTAAERAQDALWAAESELAETRSALNAARPAHDRAQRAAWKAVATEVGCR